VNPHPTPPEPVDVRDVPDAERTRLVGEYYDVMTQGFPVEELIGLDALSWREPEGRVAVLLDGTGRVDAGISAHWFAGSGTLLLTYIATRPELRRHGLGSTLIRTVVPRWAREYRPRLVLAEVEDPAHFPTRMGQDPRRRITLYHHLGVERLDVRYCLPRMNPRAERIEHYLLMVVAGLSGAVRGTGAGRWVDGDGLAAWLPEYYRAMEGEGYDDAHFRRLVADLPGARIPVVPLL
jgi:GNAT superfamily N-acetyltransferase